MKAMCHLLTVIAILFAFANNVQAQTEIKECNGKSYIFDYTNLKVYRQSLSRSSVQADMSDKFLAKPKNPIKDVYRKVFSAERLEELKAEKMVTKFTCNPTGKVENVEFLFFKEPFLSVDEIEKLEDAFMDYTFDLQVFDGESEHYIFALACFFGKI